MWNSYIVKILKSIIIEIYKVMISINVEILILLIYW
jgi:hypothetical protein